MTRPKNDPQPAARPTEPAPAPEQRCVHCRQGGDPVRGPLLKDPRSGWFLHAACLRLVDALTVLEGWGVLKGRGQAAISR